MKVMTYNIRLGIQQGVGAIAEVITAVDPDIVALQEVGLHWRMGPEGDTAADIAELTGHEHVHYVTTIVEGEHRYGHALLSRWPILSPRVFHFTQDIDEPRAALIAQVDTDKGRLAVISTHLSHKDDERAIHGTELVELVSGVACDDHPTLLMGDLNEVDDADWVHALKDRMDDAGDLVDGATYPNPEPMVRIDYLLVDGGEWTHAAVVDEAHASDHRPLVGDLLLD